MGVRLLARPAGHRLAVLFEPERGVRRRGALLFVHPFAEEMNKARRTVAQSARALAASGWTVMSLDLLGCGDSTGEFGDATWRDWIDDVAFAHAWLAEHSASAPALWGLRAGALLASAVVPRLAATFDLLLWQPVLSGRQHLNQFLRLKVAGDRLAEAGEAGTTTKALRERLHAGEVVEVAGYALSPGLALPLEEAELDLPAGFRGRVFWLEVATQADNLAVTPGSSQRIQRWNDAGIAVTSRAIRGLPFWQTQEIAECPELQAATTEILLAH